MNVKDHILTKTAIKIYIKNSEKIRNFESFTLIYINLFHNATNKINISSS